MHSKKKTKIKRGVKLRDEYRKKHNLTKNREGQKRKEMGDKKLKDNEMSLGRRKENKRGDEGRRIKYKKANTGKKDEDNFNKSSRKGVMKIRKNKGKQNSKIRKVKKEGEKMAQENVRKTRGEKASILEKICRIKVREE